MQRNKPGEDRADLCPLLNFVAHDSQMPKLGDFFMTFIGEDSVIVVPDNDGLSRVLANSCLHRGSAVFRAEEGHASSFICASHRWTYDLQGRPMGVPGFKELYHEELVDPLSPLVCAAVRALGAATAGGSGCQNRRGVKRF